jgi:hypothetical protein
VNETLNATKNAETDYFEDELSHNIYTVYSTICENIGVNPMVVKEFVMRVSNETLVHTIRKEAITSMRENK